MPPGRHDRPAPERAPPELPARRARTPPPALPGRPQRGPGPRHPRPADRARPPAPGRVAVSASGPTASRRSSSATGPRSSPSSWSRSRRSASAGSSSARPRPAYTCGQQFNPSPTPTVEPGSSTRLGFLEDDMGGATRSGAPATTCTARRLPAPTSTPPASGRSSRASTSRTTRWARRTGSTTWSTAAWSFSTGTTARGRPRPANRHSRSSSTPSRPARCAGSRRVRSRPVIARFDQMPHAYAALVWDRVLLHGHVGPGAGNPLLQRGVGATRQQRGPGGAAGGRHAVRRPAQGRRSQSRAPEASVRGAVRRSAAPSRRPQHGAVAERR